MEEQLISFETSKIAKAKGLISGIMETSWYKPSGKKAKLKDIANYESYKEDFIYAPTQSLLQKWFRDTHNIDVQSYLILIEKNKCTLQQLKSEKEYTYSIYIEGVATFNWIVSYDKSYEEALEKGLLKALKLIK